MFVELAVLPHGSSDILPGAQELTVALRHPREPPPSAGYGSVRADDLDLGMRRLGGAVVAMLPSRADRAHKVQVLRHRLLPRLGEAFGVSAGLVDVGFGVVGETGNQAMNPY